jgi:hypothetical protein
VVDVRDNGDIAKIHCIFLRMIFPENRFPLFGIMRLGSKNQSAGPRRISQGNPSSKRQQDCRMAILWTRDAMLLRRNIVTKPREATARWALGETRLSPRRTEVKLRIDQ